MLIYRIHDGQRERKDGFAHLYFIIPVGIHEVRNKESRNEGVNSFAFAWTFSIKSTIDLTA